MPHTLKLKKIPVSEKSSHHGIEEMVSVYPPSFHITDKQMQEIKDWEVGGKYRLVIEIEQTYKSESVKDDGSVAIGGDFNIIKYKYLPEKTIDEMNDKEFGEYQGKEFSKHE